MDRAQTYELILQKAEKLFTRFGAMKTPVKDIAREMKMSSANVYKFFPTKRAIIEAVMERRQAGLYDEILAETGRRTGAFERIRCLMICVLNHFDSLMDQEETEAMRIDITLDVLQLETLGPRKSWNFIRNFHEFLHLQVQRFIREGVASGEMHVPDAEEAAAAFLDCMSRVFEPFLLLEDAKPVRRERLERQLRLLERALA